MIIVEEETEATEKETGTTIEKVDIDQEEEILEIVEVIEEIEKMEREEALEEIEEEKMAKVGAIGEIVEAKLEAFNGIGKKEVVLIETITEIGIIRDGETIAESTLDVVVRGSIEMTEMEEISTKTRIDKMQR
jgi:hypothetical protein